MPQHGTCGHGTAMDRAMGTAWPSALSPFLFLSADLNYLGAFKMGDIKAIALSTLPSNLTELQQVVSFVLTLKLLHLNHIQPVHHHHRLHQIPFQIHMHPIKLVCLNTHIPRPQMLHSPPPDLNPTLLLKNR